LELFTDYYGALSQVLPIKRLSAHFVSNRIITFEEDEEIQQVSVRSEAARIFLRKIAGSLKAGLTESFDELLCIMMEYGDVSCVEIANEMILKLCS